MARPRRAHSTQKQKWERIASKLQGWRDHGRVRRSNGPFRARPVGMGVLHYRAWPRRKASQKRALWLADGYFSVLLKYLSNQSANFGKAKPMISPPWSPPFFTINSA